MNKIHAPLLAAALALTTPSAHTQSPDGPWSGAIGVLGTELKITVTFATVGDSVSAKIDIPQQLAMGLPLRNVSWKPPRTHFELPAGPGLALFDGVITGDSIHGDFMQAGIKGTFRLERGTGVRRAEAPAHAEPAPPYREEAVTLTVDSLRISGTLTIPPGNGRHPAVVLITGSGAHDRDEELFGFRPFRVIADHFTRHGIAVLRCDDRGIGGSTGSKSAVTSADHASDILAEVEYLKARADINPHQIGLCGHSEGGIIAPIAATRSKDVAFILLIAGPSISGEQLILYQLETLLRLGDMGEEEIRKTLNLQKKVFDCIRTGMGWESLAEEFRKQNASGLASLPPEKRKEIADSAAFVGANVDARLASAKTPWFRYFVEFDPAETLARVQCPVLAIFGGLDMQVPVSLDKQPMEDALRHGVTKDWKVEVIPGANHLFQAAVTGAPSEYATLEKKFVPGFLDLMTAWITRRVSVLSGAPGGQGN